MRNNNRNGAIAVKDSMADRVFNAVNLVLLGIIALIVLYPLYFVLVASVTDPMVVNSGALLLYPVDWYTKGYEKIFAYDALWTGYLNSLIYMVLGTSVNTVSYTHLTLPTILRV